MSTSVLSNIFLVTLTTWLVRWGVSLFPYSGAGSPPMYGDYEAQRHWQEITVNLPVTEWYSNSSNNDLLYWGLDYPPLTAYHSYALGCLAKSLNPDYVALNASRGYESPKHKLFMRFTVFLADLLIYFPAAIFLFRLGNKYRNNLIFIALVSYPGLILVDYGHFQYNNASLGLLVAAVAALQAKHDCLGSVLFCLALNYKQMELYHALPFFCYLLGRCYLQNTSKHGLTKLLMIGACVVATFAVVWSPFLRSSSSIAQVVTRLFPINRGLFEDKVANIWCFLSILIKFKSLFSNSTMAIVCLVSTGIFAIPPSLNLFLRPDFLRFKYSLVNVSFVFFLLSYHVHEKSILLVCVPACLLMCHEPFAVTWLLLVSVFSMLPLLDKDGLFGPFVSVTILSGLVYRSLVCNVLTAGESGLHHPAGATARLSALGCVVLTLCFKLLPSPPGLPHFFPLLIAVYSCLHFTCFAFYFHSQQFSLPDVPVQKMSKLLKKQK